MKSVGIKELKNNLSRYLKMVREGTLIFVTDHDEIIAEIHRPISPVSWQTTRWDAYLNEEAERGLVRRARHRTSRAFVKKPIEQTDLDSLALLDETREDRQ
ncbi:MAG: antitoxin PHD [Deltaproteobacteria bacterium]|nr:antitoxin PHD [Deltaproteobacteria bacterium]